MLPHLPAYVNIGFILTVVLALWFLWKASYSVPAMCITIGWLAVTGLLAGFGFFRSGTGPFPRLALAIGPPLVLIILLLTTHAGKTFVSRLSLKKLTLLSVIRIPVELCLYSLYLHEAVPELMTFSGRNLDIVSGITAPIVTYTCFKGRYVRNKSENILFAWNIICLVLLMSVMVNGILSAPTPFQQFAFDQPNIAIMYFPFVWLPCFIVMLVLFSHLVVIKRLIIR